MGVFAHTLIIINPRRACARVTVLVNPRRACARVTVLVNPRRACAARVTVVVLCVCMYVCMYVCTCMCVHSNLPPHTLESQRRDTNGFCAIQGSF